MTHSQRVRRIAWNWAVMGVAGIAALAWTLLGVERVETAPALALPFSEVALPGPAGGFAADAPDHSRSVLVATRRATGELDVECADPETAAAMMAEVRP
jgi:hypothetical protein